MKPEQYVLEITRILQTLNTPQLNYIYTYIKGYFDIKDVELSTPSDIETKKA